MKVLKFGGTSVGSPERMEHLVELVADGQPKIVVLSAVAGTTNQLQELADTILRQDIPGASQQLGALRLSYEKFVKQLFAAHPEAKPAAKKIVQDHFHFLAQQITRPFTAAIGKSILAQGELLSTAIFALLLSQKKVACQLIPALDFMRTDAKGEPDLDFLTAELSFLLEMNPQVPCFVTQGYICKNHEGKTDNLNRGGSDYTATLIGAAIGAEEVQIWTDIDGMRNNDPRVVADTFPIRHLSYREAAELAYFGAKILHPSCVLPAEKTQVPIRLKYTFQPEAPGTLISTASSGRTITAIAAKDGITAIQIRSGRMINAYGFLRKVFEVFEIYRTPIDMITTSEVAVSLTIDDTSQLPGILEALAPYGEITCQEKQTIVCIVGDQLDQHPGFTRQIFDALEDIPVRMVSYGGSQNNLSLLIPESVKSQALRQLNQKLFVQEMANGQG